MTAERLPRVRRSKATTLTERPHAGTAPGPAGHRSVDDVLRLQRAASNRAVQRLVGGERWLVDDGVTPAEGQLGRGAFLCQLRQAVAATVEAGLAGTGRTAADCPALAHWFDHYSGQDAAHVERALRMYAPEAAGAPTARDAIPLVCQRVDRAVRHWARPARSPEYRPDSTS